MRELFARTVACDPEADIEDAQQLWYVCQATYSPTGACTAVEQRYFVTSIPAETLTRDQELALVRLHWAIENNCHWTLDVMLGEDDAQPCQATKASIETVSWLRIIGYNAVRPRPMAGGRPAPRRATLRAPTPVEPNAGLRAVASGDALDCLAVIASF